MRVAIVVTGGLHPSGREQVVPSWLSLFGRLARSHSVHAFVLRHLPEASVYDLNGVTVHDLGRPSAPLGLQLWAQQHALVKAMELAGPYDLVHGFWGDPAAVLATRVARRLSLPSIVTLDSGEFVSLPDIAYGSQRTARGRARIREACTHATRVHVCTAFMAREVQKFGVTPTIIPLGVELGESGLSAEARSAKVDPAWRLLQVASLSRVKNQALLIDALAILSKTIDVHLDLVGEDTLGGALQAQAAALGVGDRVTFHGFVPHDEIVSMRRRAHLYVQTSRHESAGVAVLEAAASTLPVMGTPVGYVADWAPDKAVVADTTSPAAFATSIAALLGDESRRQHIAGRAAEFARAHSADETATQLAALYASLHVLQHR